MDGGASPTGGCQPLGVPGPRLPPEGIFQQGSDSPCPVGTPGLAGGLHHPAQSSRWEAANTNPAQGALGLCQEPHRALSIPQGLEELKLGLSVGLFAPLLQHRLSAPLGLSGLWFPKGEDEV